MDDQNLNAAALRAQLDQWAAQGAQVAFRSSELGYMFRVTQPDGRTAEHDYQLEYDAMELLSDARLPTYDSPEATARKEAREQAQQEQRSDPSAYMDAIESSVAAPQAQQDAPRPPVRTYDSIDDVPRDGQFYPLTPRPMPAFVPVESLNDLPINSPQGRAAYMDAMEAELRRATEGTGIQIERVGPDGRPRQPDLRILPEPVLDALDERRFQIEGVHPDYVRRPDGQGYEYRPNSILNTQIRLPSVEDISPGFLRFTETPPDYYHAPDFIIPNGGRPEGTTYDRKIFDPAFPGRDIPRWDGYMPPVEPIAPTPIEEITRQVRDGQPLVEPVRVDQLPAAPLPGVGELPGTPAAPEPAWTTLTPEQRAADSQAYQTMDAIRDRAMSGDVAAQNAIANLDGDGVFSVTDLMKLQTMGGDKLTELQAIAGTLGLAGVTSDAPAPAASQPGSAEPQLFETAVRAPTNTPDIRVASSETLRFA